MKNNNTNYEPDKAAIYIRVSTIDQDPEKYRQDCLNHAKKNGLEVVDVIEEEISGWKDIEREGYEQVIERAKNGEFKHIIVWDMSRWTRKPPLRVVEEMRGLKRRYNIQIHSVKEEILEFLNKDPGDEMYPIYEAMQDLILTLISWNNNRDSEIKSERVKLAYRKKKDRASRLGKKPRWGRPKKKIDEEAIYNEYMNNEKSTLRSVAEKFEISHEKVRQIIKKEKR